MLVHDPVLNLDKSKEVKDLQSLNISEQFSKLAEFDQKEICVKLIQPSNIPLAFTK